MWCHVGGLGNRYRPLSASLVRERRRTTAAQLASLWGLAAFVTRKQFLTEADPVPECDAPLTALTKR
jgi:hypothetical protein